MKFYLSIFIVFFSLFTQIVNAQVSTSFKIPRTEVIEIKDPKTDRIYPIFIKLPRSYHNDEAQSYPVIYLTDALYSFQIVSGATRFPMNTGKMKETIIVGISYSKGSKGASSRVRDYTHVEDTTWKLQTGGAEVHTNFIEKSVFTFMEKNYRINGSNTFVGNSLGGLLGAYILFNEPHLFDNYILGSPSVWFKGDNILKLKTKLNLNYHRVFIAVGAKESPKYNTTKHDMVQGARALKHKISSELFPNTTVKLIEIEGANHETAFPTTAIQGLYWLFKVAE